MSDLSLEHQIALLPKEQQEAVLADLDMETLQYDWNWTGRPSQLLPVTAQEGGDAWTLALALAGRGFGKTRMGAEWLRGVDEHWNALGRDNGHMRFALLGRTAADVRDVMLEGPSGLMNIYPPSVRDRVIWTPSRRRIELPNGSVGLVSSAEEPDQLRGPAFHIGWADEMAAYKQVRSMAEGNLTSWENLRIAVRLGSLPQILVTTTPKRVPSIKMLLEEAKNPSSRIILRRGKTMDNVKLSEGYLDVLLGLYSGTQLGKQELEGEMLDDVAGAMTSEQIIDAYRVTGVPIGIPWIKIVGVDPSVAERPHDECGIVVVYISNTYPILRRHAFVVEDLSLRASPTVWGDIVVKAAHEHGAVVVAETNQGAALVKQMVKQSAAAAGLQNPPIREVWSSKSKAVRSEPVGGAYARGRIHHVNYLTELESQATSWVTGESGYSPDRMDALVHACAAGLFPEALIHGAPGTTTVHNLAHQKIPLTRQTSLPQGRGSWGRR
jgi:phage terminase large subunit-like protein